MCVRLLIKAGGGEKKREFIHKSALERGVIERHEAKNKTKAIHSNQIVVVSSGEGCIEDNTRMKSDFFCFEENVEIVSVINSYPSNHILFFLHPPFIFLNYLPGG